MSYKDKNKNIQDFIKILIIRTDRIGDVILTLPMADVLKQNFPEATIDFMANKRAAELIYDYPNINKVHTIEKDSIKAIREICKSGAYDLAIIVHPSFTIALAVYLSRTKYRLGTAYRIYSILFNKRRHKHRKQSRMHELELNLDLLKEINCEIPQNIKLCLNVSNESILSLKSKMGSFDINKDYIIIHPGSSGSAKEWGKDNFIKFIELLLNDIEFKLNIVLTGSTEEEVMIFSILKKFELKDRIYSFTNLTLKELSGLIKFSKMFVSNSTGPIHIAAAVGTFVVGFYPAKINESATRWGPYTDKKKIFNSKLQDLQQEFLDDIKPDDVYNFIKSYFVN